MLAILPIKLYEKYWDTAVLSLEHINLFEHIGELTHSQTIPRLLSFITASGIVSVYDQGTGSGERF